MSSFVASVLEGEVVECSNIYPTDQETCSISTGNNQHNSKFDLDEEALLKLVIETTPDGLIIINETGIIQSFNPAAERMFGFKADEIIGENVSELMPASYGEKHDGFLARYLKTGNKTIIGIGREVVARKKNGTVFPVELAVGEVSNKGKRLFTGFIRDLTAHRISEKQITRLQNELIHVARHSAMGELATTLSHELNQPLTAIANYTLVTKKLVDNLKDCPQTEPVLELLDKAAVQAQRAGEVIRSIRAFIKHHDNKFSWENLEDAVSEAVKIATIGTANEHIEVKISKSCDLPLVCMDRIQIQQVVTNLVRNAIDAVRQQEGERIVRIHMECHGQRSVIVRVTDNGPGLNPDVEKRLFEAFNTSKADGVGIGLAISKTIITSHNGEIRGRNDSEKGAEFYFVLPIDSKAEEIG